jgi:hypothetical protein
VFAAVWMVAARHGERAQINRRIAEEVAEGRRFMDNPDLTYDCNHEAHAI